MSKVYNYRWNVRIYEYINSLINQFNRFLALL